MIRIVLLALSVAFSGAFFGACTRYTVIKQAQPAPFAAAQCKIGVGAVVFRDLKVGDTSHEAWLAKKSTEDAESHNADLDLFSKIFVNATVSAATPFASASLNAPFVAIARLTEWEPGFYTAFVNRDTDVVMAIDINDAKGELVDQIRIDTRVVASLANPSVGGRFHTAAKRLAEIFAEYLTQRLGCPR